MNIPHDIPPPPPPPPPQEKSPKRYTETIAPALVGVGLVLLVLLSVFFLFRCHRQTQIDGESDPETTSSSSDDAEVLEHSKQQPGSANDADKSSDEVEPSGQSQLERPTEDIDKALSDLQKNLRDELLDDTSDDAEFADPEMAVYRRLSVYYGYSVEAMILLLEAACPQTMPSELGAIRVELSAIKGTPPYYHGMIAHRAYVLAQLMQILYENLREPSKAGGIYTPYRDTGLNFGSHNIHATSAKDTNDSLLLIVKHFDPAAVARARLPEDMARASNSRTHGILSYTEQMMSVRLKALSLYASTRGGSILTKAALQRFEKERTACSEFSDQVFERMACNAQTQSEMLLMIAQSYASQ